ncbi:hypothetical protein [Demequina sp. SO4-18]
MSTEDNLKKAKDQPATVAKDHLDDAAEQIADDTSAAPGESSEDGKG